jgi:hypothetical protein
MKSLTLSRNGFIARYLGFVVGDPTYKPSNFCTLFWVLLFSPVIFIACQIMDLWVNTQRAIDKAIENSLNRQATQLAIRYEAFPDEALIDWWQHYSRYRYDIRRDDKVRNQKLVEAAFKILAEKFNEIWALEVLVRIGAIAEGSENLVSNRYFQLVTPRTRKNNWKSIWNFWEWHAILLSATFFVFLPVLWTVPEVAFIFSTAWVLAIFGGLIFRLEINIVIYNMYKAVKDKTCPLIVWD